MQKKHLIGLGVSSAFMLGTLATCQLSRGRSDQLTAWVQSGQMPIIDDQMNIGVMLHGYNGPLAGLPLSAPPFSRRLSPVLLSIDGCGFSHTSEGVAADVAILTAGERTEEQLWATLEACRYHNPKALENTLNKEIDALLGATRYRQWFDSKSVIVLGYGDAAPLVAMMKRKVAGRITVGDPCFIPWRAISAQSPLTILLTSTPSARGVNASSSQGIACPAQKRPGNFGAAKVVQIEGRMGSVSRPLGLDKALYAAYSTASIAR